MGYVTHGIIDSFTSYGTLLYWPFSNERVALNLVSVIDPLFTIPIFIFVIYGVIKRSKVFSMCAILWVFTYQATAYLQKDRAENLIYEYALKNGHDVEKILAKPSFANIVVWKVIYSTSDKYYVNAIRLGKSHKLYPGESIDKLDIKKIFHG